MSASRNYERMFDVVFEREILSLQAKIIEYEVRLINSSKSGGEHGAVERIVYSAAVSHLKKELKEMVGFNKHATWDAHKKTSIPFHHAVSEPLEIG